MTEEQENFAYDLEAQGWNRQFLVESERVDEYVDLYQSLGNEVRVEPVTPDLIQSEECSTCYLALCDKYVVVYTRSSE